MITIENLTKKFGEFTAVDDLSIRIKSGNFYGFLGPNGAGKTTTIKIITGLTGASSGKVSINGFDIKKAPLEAKMATGYIPDQPYLYDKLTGREFLYFTAGLYKMDHIAATEQIKHFSQLIEFDSWLDQRTEFYSQGMKQRIVIAAALMNGPKALVIDEPMVGLDPKGVKIVKQLLKERASAGTAIFMSTHSLPVVEELCDRIGVINRGRLIFEGSAEEFRRSKDIADGKFESAFLELTR